MTRVIIDEKALYGDILERSNSKILLLCALTGEKIEILLGDSYMIETTEEDYLNKYIDLINNVKINSLFLKNDYGIIKNADNVVSKYEEIHLLRSLGFKENKISKIDIKKWKDALVSVAQTEYTKNINLINEDEDLNEAEKQVVIDSFLMQFNNFTNTLNEMDDVLVILKNFPNNFVDERLQYMSTIIRILENEKSLSCNV
jgi:hypothetical protein